jgi:hypothetical protein
MLLLLLLPEGHRAEEEELEEEKMEEEGTQSVLQI